MHVRMKLWAQGFTSAQTGVRQGLWPTPSLLTVCCEIEMNDFSIVPHPMMIIITIIICMIIKKYYLYFAADLDNLV